jgi:hypothetical protein
MSRIDEHAPGQWQERIKLRPSLRKRHGSTISLLIILGAAFAVAIVIGLLIPARSRIWDDSARAQSQNNLRQIGIGIQNIAAVYNGLEPPVVGQFPLNGPDSTIFFQLLPHIEQDNIYKIGINNGALAPGAAPVNLSNGNGTVKIYCAPGDPTNPGTGTLLTSYCVNGAVFDGRHGGSVHFPRVFNAKGAADTIICFERFAAMRSAPRQWNDPTPHRVWLYSLYDGGAGFDAFPYASLPPAASIDTGFFDSDGNGGEVDFGRGPGNFRLRGRPNAMNTETIDVLLGDGSAREVSTKANATFDVDGRQVRIWAWACSLHGSLGKAPVPSGW